MSGRMIGGGIVAAVLIVALATAAFVLLGDDDSDEFDDDAAGTIALGESTYRQLCAGCHTIDGSSSVGPTFEGLYNSEVEMDDGSIVLVDREHLQQAIIDPRATTRDEYPDVMPAFTNLSDNEIAGLIAFIESLE